MAELGPGGSDPETRIGSFSANRRLRHRSNRDPLLISVEISGKGRKKKKKKLITQKSKLGFGSASCNASNWRASFSGYSGSV